MYNKHHKPAAQADGQRYSVVQVDLRTPDLAIEQQGLRRLACFAADKLFPGSTLRAELLKHDWIEGAFRGAAHIVLLAGAQRPEGVPFLAPANKSMVAMALPARGAVDHDESFFVAWRTAIGAMLGRPHGCRVTFCAPGALSLYEDPDLPAGQVDMTVGGLVPRGGSGLAEPPEAYPARVLADMMLLSQRARKVAHWSKRGLHPTFPDDDKAYIGPALSVRCELIGRASWWGAALLDGCTNAAEFEVVRPDSTRGFAKRGRDGDFRIVMLEPSPLMRGSARA